MKSILFLILFTIIYAWASAQGTRKTPTGVSISVEYGEQFSEPQIVAGDAFWQDSILSAGWSANIIGSCSGRYNCHGYAWHMSDGGDTIRIPYDADVEKYYTGEYATYTETDGPGKYVKVYYNGAQHSAIVDSDYPNWVISKWGSGPLVRHLPGDCPFYDPYTLEYYKLIINEQPTSVAKGCATNVSTLNIANASYSWSGDNVYLCASGSDYIGEVTGLNTTPESETKVEITSPFSNTTVKGIKELAVTSAPSAPYITGSTLVCSCGEEFTLQNVPSGNTITWTSSSNLSTSDSHANPCTFVPTSNGSGWIKATVSTDCDESTFSIEEYDVWSGTPVISYIDGPGSTPNMQWAYYTAQLQGSTNVDDYNWILSPLNGNSVYDYGHYCDIAFYNSGDYQLIGQAHNTCGWSNYAIKWINVYDSYYMMVTPNPATSEVTVLIAPSFLEGSTLESASTEATFDENTEWDIEVYDNMQSLKLKKQKLKGNSTRINTQSWKEGVYMVRVKYNDELLTGKLIVKK